MREHTPFIEETSNALALELGLTSVDIYKIISYFTRNIPIQETEDVVQDIVVALLNRRPNTLGLLHSIVRGRVSDWWKHHLRRQHRSLDYQLMDSCPELSGDQADQQQGTSYELDFAAEPHACSVVITADQDFESQLCAAIDIKDYWSRLPDPLKVIVGKRLNRIALSAAERQRLRRWLRSELHTLYFSRISAR